MQASKLGVVAFFFFLKKLLDFPEQLCRERFFFQSPNCGYLGSVRTRDVVLVFQYDVVYQSRVESAVLTLEGESCVLCLGMQYCLVCVGVVL